VTEKAWNRARGRSPHDAAARTLMISTADAPSVSGEEFPGVILQSIAGKACGRVRRDERGPQRAQGLGRCVRPKRLVASVRSGAAVPVDDGHCDDLTRERSRVPGGRSTLVGGHRVRVQRVAIKLPPRRDQFGRDALLDQPLGIARGDARAERVGARGGGPHRNAAHRLHSARDHDVVGTRDHALGGEVDGLLAGAALAIDGGRRYGLSESRGQHGAAGDVEALFARLLHAPGDDVIHLRRLDVVAGDEHPAQQFHRVTARQRPTRLALPGGQPDHVHDDCLVQFCPLGVV
jgi:hypothetical protein